MRARSIATAAGLVALAALVLTGPVAGAAGGEVQAEVVTEKVDGLSTARDAVGEPVIDSDPEHAELLEKLERRHEEGSHRHPARAGGGGHAAEAEHDHAEDSDEAEHDHALDDHAHAEGEAIPQGAAEGVLSEAEEMPIAFSMIGFAVPEGVGVSFRYRHGDGQWSEWEPVHVDPDEGPDVGGGERDAWAGEDGRLPGVPTWTGKADQLQLRVDGADPEDIGVNLVDGLGQNRDLGERVGDAVAAVALAVLPGASPAAASAEQPDIVSRDDWGAASAGSPSYADDARGVVIHHTATSNGYSRDQSKAVVRSIQRYHMDHNGWSDIGYNFLVDRYGTVYEGRDGGIERPVIGAHAAGHNTGTIGVSFIGQHHSGLSNPAFESVSREAKQAAGELLVWLFGVHDMDASSTATLKGGFEFASWQHRIVGHGTVGSTTCPGSSVDDFLPDLRKAVLDSQLDSSDESDDEESDDDEELDDALELSVETAAVTDVGESVELAASLTEDGEGVGGRQLRWEWQGPGEGDAGSDSSQTDSDGQATASWQSDVLGQRLVKVCANADNPAPDDCDDAVATAESSITWQPVLERLAGHTRHVTSVKISKAVYEQADRVVLASAADYPDALAGAGLAGQLDAPVLLTSSGGVDSPVAAEVERLGANEAVLLGSEGAISEDVAGELEEMGLAVKRLSGPERFSTAAAIAGEVAGADTVMVANGVDGWPDALVASQIAAAEERAVLLTEDGELPEPTVEALEQLDAERIVVVGGTRVVSEDVAEALEEYGEVVRVAGSNRLETSARMAEAAVALGADPQYLWIASATNWPDALAAGPAAARAGEVLLLSWPDRWENGSGVAQQFAETTRHVRLVGGSRALTPELESAVGEMLGRVGTP